MTRSEIIQAVQSALDHVGEMGDVLDDVDKLGVTVKSRIPEATQTPYQDLLARDLLPEACIPPLREHDLADVLKFRLMSLEVELPNLLAALVANEEL